MCSVSDYISTLALSLRACPCSSSCSQLLLLVAAIAAAYFMYKRAASATYLVDFYSFRPPSRQV